MGQKFPTVRPVEKHIQRLSLTLPRPKEETLSKHSTFGPNGFQGQLQPPVIDKWIIYPTNIDLSPVEIPSLKQNLEEWTREKDMTVAEDLMQVAVAVEQQRQTERERAEEKRRNP